MRRLRRFLQLVLTAFHESFGICASSLETSIAARQRLGFETVFGQSHDPN
jgi:hypothetical protein